MWLYLLCITVLMLASASLRGDGSPTESFPEESHSEATLATSDSTFRHLATGNADAAISPEHAPLSPEDNEILAKVLQRFNEHKLMKKTHGLNNRLVFVVGLEGSGHHMVRALVKKCTETGIKVCKHELQVSRILFKHQKHHQKDTYNGLFGADEYGKHGNLLVQLYKRLVQLAEDAKGRRQLLFLNTHDDEQSGMLSYSNFQGPYRDLHNPDLHVLSAVADAAGVDLRLLVLQRSALELWRSFHSRFYEKASLMGMMNSATNLFRQLRQVSPEYFMCVPYGEFATYKTDSRGNAVADFLHPGLAQQRYFLWQTMLKGVRRKKKSDDKNGTHAPYPPADRTAELIQGERYNLPDATIRLHLAQYQGVIDLVDSVCNESTHRLPPSGRSGV